MPRVYWEMGDELFELNRIILKGERILVPTSLRTEMVEKFHQGHIWAYRNASEEQETCYTAQ